MIVDVQLDKRDFAAYQHFLTGSAGVVGRHAGDSLVMRIGPPVIAALLAALLIWLAVTFADALSGFTVNVIMAGLGFAAGLVFAIALIRRLGRRLRPRDGGAFYAPKRIHIDADGIETDADRWRAFAAWPGILRFEETERHFSLMIDTNVGHIIPKRAFDDDTQLGEFRDLLADRVAPAA